MVHSLCIADQLGVLKSIEHIAKTLHTENQPPPPPYVSYPKPIRQGSNSELASNSVTTGKAHLEAVGTADKCKDNAWSEESKEAEHSNSATPLQPCHMDTGPEQGATVSKPLVERDGLRRRRKGEERESKAVDLDSEEKVESDAVTTIDTSETFRNVYYGVGAGTFLY